MTPTEEEDMANALLVVLTTQSMILGLLSAVGERLQALEQMHEPQVPEQTLQ